MTLFATKITATKAEVITSATKSMEPFIINEDGEIIDQKENVYETPLYYC